MFIFLQRWFVIVYFLCIIRITVRLYLLICIHPLRYWSTHIILFLFLNVFILIKSQSSPVMSIENWRKSSKIDLDRMKIKENTDIWGEFDWMIRKRMLCKDCAFASLPFSGIDFNSVVSNIYIYKQSYRSERKGDGWAEANVATADSSYSRVSSNFVWIRHGINCCFFSFSTRFNWISHYFNSHFESKLWSSGEIGLNLRIVLTGEVDSSEIWLYLKNVEVSHLIRWKWSFGNEFWTIIL